MDVRVLRLLRHAAEPRPGLHHPRVSERLILRLPFRNCVFVFWWEKTLEVRVGVVFFRGVVLKGFTRRTDGRFSLDLGSARQSRCIPDTYV